MKSSLTFLIASIAAGGCLVFSAATAQQLPSVFESLWMASIKITYDPLLVAAFILAMTLAAGRTIDILREREQRRGELHLDPAVAH